MVLRAKTMDLLRTKPITQKQESNSILNLNELNSSLFWLSSYPRRIILELTNACNLHCIMCGRQEKSFKPHFLELKYIQKFGPILDLIEEITLMGWGEPTIHPQLGAILNFLNSYPVTKYLVTNGMKLGEIQELLFQYSVDILGVSLDGGTAETNNRIRKGGDFDKIVGNLREMIKARQARQQKNPYVNLVFTVMQSNLYELPRLVELAADIGLEEVKVVYLTVFGDSLSHETLFNHQSEVQAVFGEAERLAGKLGVLLKLPYIQGEDPAGVGNHKPCYVSWRDFFVGSDGYIRPCQSTPRKLFSIGTKDDTIENFIDIWNSPEFIDFRRTVNDENTMPQECKRCYQSSYANWNQKHAFWQIDQDFAPQWVDNIK